ncbi:MAG: ArsR family transcriptional regulator [Streptococcus sp.]|nr:ArsR family transcriptional regulator [Streptococcus sp.]
MKFQINQEENKCIEYLMFPYLKFIDVDSEAFVSYKNKLKDVLADMEQIKVLLKPFTKEIDRLLLPDINYQNFYESLLNHVVENGYVVTDLEELFTFWETLPEEQLYQNFYEILSDEEQVNKNNFIQFLEQCTDNPQIKWSWIIAHEDLKEHLHQAIALYRKISPLYTPFYKKYQKEVANVAKNFRLDETIHELEETFFTSVATAFEKLKKENHQECFVRLLSPFFDEIILLCKQNKKNSPIYFKINVRYQSTYHDISKLDEKRSIAILKTLSDENRYKVLKELVNGDLKSKEIAKKLKLTPANISFHTQKLINQQIIGLEQDKTKGSKYSLNKNMLNEVISLIKKDLDL